MTFHQLPDLARLRAFEARVRESDDETVADLLCSDEGQWAFGEAAAYLTSDVSMRLVRIMMAGVPAGAFFELLGITPTNEGA